MFQMENPLMRMLTKIGNFILVSFYWLLTCIPVVTIIPACTALFHTVTKVIRQDGEGVTADFFSAFRHALHPGVLLSLITAGGSLLLYTCVDFGYQMMRQNAVGTAYFSVGCILAYAWTATVFYLAPALSRFEGGVLDILRIAFYLPFRNFFSVLLQMILLAVMIFVVDFYPVLLLIVPALYVDLTCSGVEKALQRLVALSGAKEPEKQTDAEREREQCLEFGGLSALEQAAHMNDSEE